MDEKSVSVMNCPVCFSEDTLFIIEVTEMPVHCHLLWTQRSAAVKVPRGDISLRYCCRCQHIYNQTFDPALMAYSQEYDNSLHFSPHFQNYASSLAKNLAYRYQLRGKRIVEIGCGKGDFLSMLCQFSGASGVGFDPSYVPDSNHRELNLTFIQDFYSEKYVAEAKADFICCRHVLEHVTQPEHFVETVRRMNIKSHDTFVFFEVPNSMYTISSLGIWDIIYEHYSYFSSHSLGFLFQKCGFDLLEVSETFGQQFLTIEARLPGDNFHPNHIALKHLDDMEIKVVKFAQNHRLKVSLWQQFLEQLAGMNKQVVLWGAGSKGVTFLNIMQGIGNIQYVVDINPRKQGMFVTGSGQEIVPPEFLKTYRPDVVILMNPVYRHEVQAELQQMGISPRLLTV